MLHVVSALATQEQRPPAAIQPIAPAKLTRPAGDSGLHSRPRFRVLHGLQLFEPSAGMAQVGAEPPKRRNYLAVSADQRGGCLAWLGLPMAWNLARAVLPSFAG